MKFMARKKFVGFGFGVELFGYEDPNGRHSELVIVEAVTMREHPEGKTLEPFLRLGQKEAQNLIDALWEAGVRPTNGEGSTGQLAATEKHLLDMRAIAFKRLGMLPDAIGVKVKP